MPPFAATLVSFLFHMVPSHPALFHSQMAADSRRSNSAGLSLPTERLKKPPADSFSKKSVISKKQTWTGEFFPHIISVHPNCLLNSGGLKRNPQPNLWSLKHSGGSNNGFNNSPGPPLSSAKPGKLGETKKKPIKPRSAARGNDRIISYGNEKAVLQGRKFENSTMGPAVIECHSQEVVWLSTDWRKL